MNCGRENRELLILVLMSWMLLLFRNSGGRSRGPMPAQFLVGISLDRSKKLDYLYSSLETTAYGIE